MVNDKLKYSLIAGSLYNIHCDYIFNVYVNGKKTELTKKIDYSTLEKISDGDTKDGKFNFDGSNFDSYEKYKEKNKNQVFDDYLRWVLFYKEKSNKSNILHDCFYTAMEYNGKKIQDFDDIPETKHLSDSFKFDVYFIKKAEYKIKNETEVLSENFINSYIPLKNDKNIKVDIKKEIKNQLDNLKNINCCITYSELSNKLNLFDVYVNNIKIDEDDKKYITPEESQNLFLIPKVDFQKIKTITLNFNNNGHKISQKIDIPSYVTLKYIKGSEYGHSRDEKNCYDISNNGLEFYYKNNQLNDADIIKDELSVEVKKYFVAIIKSVIHEQFINNGKLVEVEKLDDYINDYKKKNKLIGKQHLIRPVVNYKFIHENYLNISTNQIYIGVSCTTNEKEPAKPVEEPAKPVEEPAKPVEEPAKPTGANIDLEAAPTPKKGYSGKIIEQK